MTKPHEKNRGPDTELSSLDTSWNATTSRDTQGDGDGDSDSLVEQGHGIIRHTVGIDVRFDSKKYSAGLEEGRQSRRR